MTDMKSAVPSVDEAVAETAAQLLNTLDGASRATVIASTIAGLIPDSACIVHLHRPQNDSASWTIAGMAGEISIIDAQHDGDWLFAVSDTNSAEGQIYDRTR